MIIDDRQRNLFTCGKVISNVLFTPSNQQCEHLPVNGYYNEMMHYFEGSTDFELYCEYIDTEAIDYVPNKSKDDFGNLMSPILTKDHEKHIFKYLRQLKFSFYTHNTYNSFSKVTLANKETKTIINDEGDMITEADLLEDELSDTDLKLLQYREKFPYLLRNLHNKGKRWGYSTLSCIRAILLYNTPDKYKFRNMAKYGIWKMSCITGECTSLIEVNNGKFQEYFRPWLEGKFKDIFYEDLREFMLICIEANIDMENLDPKKYGQSFIDSLPIKFFTPNHELAARNKSICNDIQHNNQEVPANIDLYEYLTETIQTQKNKLFITIENALNYFSILTVERDTKTLDTINKLGVLPDDFYFDENGFLVDEHDSVCILDMSCLANINYQFSCKECIYHCSGNLIAITGEKDEFLYLPSNLIVMYVQSKLNHMENSSVITYYYKTKKKPWGTWLKYII